MSRKLPPFMVIKDGRYQTRLVVPARARAILKKKQLWRALSGNFTDALTLHPQALAELRALIAEAEAGLEPHPPAPLRSHSTSRTPRQIAYELYQAELAKDERDRLFRLNPEADEHRPAQLQALARIATGEADRESKIGESEVGATLGWALSEFAPDVKRGTPEWFDLAHNMAGVMIETLKRTTERDRNDWTGTPRHPLLAVPEDNGRPDPRYIKPESELDIEAVAERVIAEKQPSSGTANEYRVAARMLSEYLGSKRAVFKVTADDAIAYKDALLRTPSNYTKRFPGKSLPQAIEANAKMAKPYPVLDRTTIRDKWLARTKSIFSFAVNNRFIPDNPFAAVKVDEAKGSPKKKRVKFNTPDLVAIFSSPLLRNDREYRDEKYWALVIGLHTGARASELAQLELDSIRKEDGVLCFAIEEETKNEQSVRLVPVHNTLLNLGLEKRIARLRADGETHLFPVWFEKGKTSKEFARANNKVEKQPFAAFIPRWLNRTLLPSLGITDKTKVFHSFRYTLKSALENAEVGADISDRITGHEDGSTGRGYVQYGLQTLQKAINKGRFMEVEEILNRT